MQNSKKLYDLILPMINGVNKQLQDSINKQQELQQESEDIARAIMVAQLVASQTQNKIKVEISNMINSCMNSVFPNTYNFDFDFVVSNNTTHIEIKLKDNKTGCILDPLTSNGGGLLDLLSLLFRIAVYKISTKKTRPVFVMDEPFKNISAGYKQDFCKILRFLVDKYNFQFIIITHDNTLTEIADNTIYVTKSV